MAALSHKIAIVTGASSGIGYATAKLFAPVTMAILWESAAMLRSSLYRRCDHPSEPATGALSVSCEGRGRRHARPRRAPLDCRHGHRGFCMKEFHSAVDIVLSM